jgi:hypothetical protein
MKTLLVAVLSEDRAQVPGLAADAFTVCIASSLKEAKSVLDSGGIYGIVCGVHFNEGDFFEFLAMVRANPETSSLPFIVVKGAEGRLHPESYRVVEMACEQQRIPYLDATEMVQRLGIEAGNAELRRTIGHFLESFADGDHDGETSQDGI